MADSDLINRYGQPERFDAARALRAVGLRDQIHPYHVMAWRYPSREAAVAFAERNRTHHGGTVLGPYSTDGGEINIRDLRPSVLGGDVRLDLDPALPDDYVPALDARRSG